MTSLSHLAPDRSHDPILQRLPEAVHLFCVGGAVRDALMGWPSTDRDYLVVGATPEVMIAAGFRPVGNDFPVFLHPQTQAEYALARTERKSAPGYRGFVFHASPDVRLEEDLARRDLTINAMAVDREGLLHDPFQGQKDLSEKTLRHISSAFSEDPVRLLRVARFLARWPGFQVAPETLALCLTIVEQGEVNALVPERVWQELWRGLQSPAPTAMVRFLAQVRCYATITGLECPEPKDLDVLARLREAALPTALLAAWLWGAQRADKTTRLPLPREVVQWAALLARNSAYPPLGLSFSDWPRAIVVWAETADLFRQPDRLDPLLCLGRLTAPEGVSAEWQGRQNQWASLTRQLIRHPVGLAAQAAARAGLPIADAVQAERVSFLTRALNLL